jgi:streptomycin 6-kinase
LTRSTVLVEPTFRAFVARQFGAQGHAWLDSLPATRDQLTAEWSLELGRELTGGVLAFVCEATIADGTPAVLKVAGPWDRPADEITCLELWNGRATPRLFRADDRRGALLLERIEPGSNGADARGDEAAAVLRELHVPPPDELRSLGEAVRRRLARAVVERRANDQRARWALAAIERLEQDSPAPVLLHGDFDHRNLLRCSRRGLAAIDPLACAGDPAYDAGYWAQAAGLPGRRARTTAIADALGLDVRRVRAWCAVVTVHG